MTKDKNNKSKLVKFETPETPRARTRGNQDIKETQAKAKKYDELMRLIATDKAICELTISDLTKHKSFIRLGYMNGYTDGKVSALEATQARLEKYLEEAKK